MAKKSRQQIPVTDGCRIKTQLHDFGVTAVSPTDFLIARILCMATAVARSCAEHAVQLIKCGLNAPEAAATKSCGINLCRHAFTFQVMQ